MAAKKKSPAKKSAPKTKPAAKAKAPAKKTAAKKPVGKKVVKSKKSATGARKTATRKVAGKKTTSRTQRVARRPAVSRKPAPKKKVVKASGAQLPAAPEALALAKTIVGIANEKKAENVLVIDTRARASSVGYDYIVLASGDSDRQLAAIQEGVDALLKSQGKRVASVEASPDWVCANFDEGVVAHFFTPDRREQMDLEDLWKDAPRVAV
ncbi:MAG: ribosome silencing factor [Archangium sp.]